jgi:hypothetical protein
VEQLGVILSALTAAKIQNWFVLDVKPSNQKFQQTAVDL